MTTALTAPEHIESQTAEGWGPVNATHMHVVLTEHPDRTPRLNAHRADRCDGEYCHPGRPQQESRRPDLNPNLRTFLGSWPVIATRDSDGDVALHTCAAEVVDGLEEQ